MQIISTALTSTAYEDFKNQHLSLDVVVTGFSHVSVSPYNRKEPVSQKLRTCLEHARVYQRSIKKNSSVIVQGHEITSSVLAEGLEYFCRAFYNFYAHDELIQHGYSTWSGVTNYYASLFCLHSLLRLQGRSITRIWRESDGRQFYIFPHDFVGHEYVVCPERRPHHGATFELYYSVYDSFYYPKNPPLEYAFKRKYVGTAEEESDFRNQINYVPYQGYQEVRDPRLVPDIIKRYVEKFSQNEVEALTALTTDPDYMYYARTVLRLLFCYALLNDIAQKNTELKSLLANTKGALSEFLRQVQARSQKDTIAGKLPELMNS